MSKPNKSVLNLITAGAKLVKAEQNANALYKTAKDARVEHMAKLADAGALKGMEQKTARVTRVVREQVSANVAYGKLIEDLAAEFPGAVADRIEELKIEHYNRTTSLTVKELENS